MQLCYTCTQPAPSLPARCLNACTHDKLRVCHSACMHILLALLMLHTTPRLIEIEVHTKHADRLTLQQGLLTLFGTQRLVMLKSRNQCLHMHKWHAEYTGKQVYSLCPSGAGDATQSWCCLPDCIQLASQLMASSDHLRRFMSYQTVAVFSCCVKAAWGHTPDVHTQTPAMWQLEGPMQT